MTNIQSHILLCHSTGTHLINPVAVVRVEAISNYSKLYFTNGKTLVVAKVLKWFENKLTDEGFIRIHRTHLINKAAVKTIVQNNMQLYTEEWLTISKRKKNECLCKLRNLSAA